MTDPYIQREAVSVPPVDDAKPGEGRRIDIRLVAWGDVATQTAEGIKETVARGAFAGTDPKRVILESTRHDGSVVGVAESIDEREDGAYGVFRVASTPAGDELLTLAREGVMADASIVARPIKSRTLKGGVIERTSMELHRVAVLPRGAYPSAKVLAVRAAADEETPPVDAELIARFDALDGRVDKLAALATVPPGGNSAVAELAKFPDLGAYAQAVWRGEAPDDLIARTFADQITSQNDGLNPVGWITDVKRIVNLGRRAINAFGGPASLPAKGMAIKYPFLASANTLVAVQSSQKSEIQSARVDVDDADASIVTYAGGSDISIQLLERGDPSYLSIYQRVMTNYWSQLTDAAFVTALEAGTQTQLMGNALGAPIALATSAHADDIFDTGSAHGFSVGDAVVHTSLTGGDATTAALVNRVVWITDTSFAAQTYRPSLTPGGAPITFGTADLSAGTVRKVNTTAQGLRTSLFQASVQVETATGAPASIALASTDVFLALAGLTDVVPNYDGNPANASGIAMADSLRMNISGLEIIHKSAVTAGKVIVSNPLAAQWHEDGPKWLDATNAQKLGRDVSIYSFGAGIVFVPAGVVELTFTTPA